MAKIKNLRTASDKSISHRAAIISSIAKRDVVVKNYLFAEDTVNTIKALSKLGIEIEINASGIVVHPKGKHSLSEPLDVLDMGNSGTGMRLLSGLLCGFDFLSILTGDDSLKKRPMMRIIDPLEKLGARFMYRKNGYAPLAIYGSRKLSGIDYMPEVASAQVKSAILLAGLFAESDVCITENIESRNHTENMLKCFGVDVLENNNRVCLGKNREPYGDCEISVPADISSSAFFMVFALLKEKFELILNDVGLNDTRDGIFDVFSQCAADFEVINKRVENNELVGDVLLKQSGHLKPFTIDKNILPTLIDEVPILSILAIYCDGVSVIKDASELRKKESDRIKAMCENLKRVGVKVEEFDDGFKIFGSPKHKINTAKIDTYSDHRIAMSFAILSAVSGADLRLSETHSIKTSYPGFFDHLNYVASSI
jgi:3-phosphoshikimate 1-carboxyvinyltransferase